MSPVMQVVCNVLLESKTTFFIKYIDDIIRNFDNGAKRQLLHLMTFGTFNLRSKKIITIFGMTSFSYALKKNKVSWV